MRLDKYLANAGYGSRSEVKELVRKGRITVNGIAVKDPGAEIKDFDEVFVDGKKTAGTSSLNRTHWYMLNKPSGLVSANSDNKDKTVIGLFDRERNKNLFTVGRLDKDTEGLLLVSDDGELGHFLLSPSRHVEKTYFVKVSGELKKDAAQLLTQRIEFKDFTSQPAKLEIMGIDADGLSEVLLTITEGKFHEVKRLIAAVGGEVVYLKRITFGPLTLDDTLKSGEYRELTDEEIRLLRAAVGKADAP